MLQRSLSCCFLCGAQLFALGSSVLSVSVLNLNQIDVKLQFAETFRSCLRLAKLAVRSIEETYLTAPKHKRFLI